MLVIVCAFSVSAFAEIIEKEDENGDKILTSNLLSDEENSSLTDIQKILLKSYGSASDNLNDSIRSGDASASVYSLSISADDTNGLKAVLLDLMGDYEPIVTDYTYRQGSSSYESHSIDVQPDFVWLSSFVIFSLIIYCLFRLGGAMFG